MVSADGDVKNVRDFPPMLKETSKRFPPVLSLTPAPGLRRSKGVRKALHPPGEDGLLCCTPPGHPRTQAGCVHCGTLIVQKRTLYNHTPFKNHSEPNVDVQKWLSRKNITQNQNVKTM